MSATFSSVISLNILCFLWFQFSVFEKSYLYILLPCLVFHLSFLILFNSLFFYILFCSLFLNPIFYYYSPLFFLLFDLIVRSHDIFSSSLWKRFTFPPFQPTKRQLQGYSPRQGFSPPLSCSKRLLPTNVLCLWIFISPNSLVTDVAQGSSHYQLIILFPSVQNKITCKLYLY